MMSVAQRQELLGVAGSLQGAGVLDYVAAWYLKAAQLAQQLLIRTAFVSTNSITQGEQVSILWGEMLRLGINIQFAHRTFKWSNEARGNAQVFCVIVGFGREELPLRRLFDYTTPRSEPQELKVKNINPYLVDAEDVIVAKRSKPLSNVPNMLFGNMPNDGGFLILSDEEKEALVAQEPNAAPFIRPFFGSEEFINNRSRWCLWLKNASPSELQKMPLVRERVAKVKQVREASSREATRKLAQYPQLFGEIRQPETDYLVMPLVSSENRRYVPIGFSKAWNIASNLVSVVPNASSYLFGVLTSQMHMAWMRAVCGRLEGRYRYSGLIVYNNFPFPQAPSPKQVAAVETAAQAVLAARAEFPTESLATLYDPLTMPPALVRAHAALDRAVDACYRPAAFPTELSRLEFLFQAYRQLQAPLLPAPQAKPKQARRRTT